MTLSEVHPYLDSFINFEITPLESMRANVKFERVVRLAQALGDPQARLPVIHVAGSKGKGSVCAMTASVLRAAGYRVGLYTSPHLVSCRERIRLLDQGRPAEAASGDVFGDQISASDLAGLVEELRPEIEVFRQRRADLGRLSFFEVFTLMAFHYFSCQKVDVVVCETGVGGRLDATNVALSQLVALTPISLEHTALLGNTRELIAREKSGIIKPTTRRVVVGLQEADAAREIARHCGKLGVPMDAVDPAVLRKVISHDRGMRLEVETADGRGLWLEVPLLGRHQAENALTVLRLVDALREWRFPVSPQAVEAGLAGVVWPGRFERFVWRGRRVVCDCAHTEDSGRKLASAVAEIYPGARPVLVFGVSADKNAVALAGALGECAGSVVVTSACHPRARRFSLEEARALFPRADSVTVTPSVEEALAAAEARSAAGACPEAGGLIVVAGSVFLVAEIRTRLIQG